MTDYKELKRLAQAVNEYDKSASWASPDIVLGLIDRIEALQTELTEETMRGLMLEKSNEVLRAEVKAAQQLAQLNGEIAAELKGERDALQSRLTALEGQEPNIYVHNDGLEVWGAKANPEYANNPNFTAYYLASGAAPQQAEPLKAFARVSSRPIPKEQT